MNQHKMHWNFTTQVNEGVLQISQEQMFVEVFGPKRHGQVHGYGAGVTPTKLWGSSSSRMHDLEQRLQEFEHKSLESEHKHLEADVELKEVKHLKSMLKQQAIQMLNLVVITKVLSYCISPNNDAFACAYVIVLVTSQPVSEIYADEAISEDFDGGFPGSDCSISPPPMEMEPEEVFTLREWRRLD
nr:hypothetical protein CFP56_70183 [Quercus suber]